MNFRERSRLPFPQTLLGSSPGTKLSGRMSVAEIKDASLWENRTESDGISPREREGKRGANHRMKIRADSKLRTQIDMRSPPKTSEELWAFRRGNARRMRIQWVGRKWAEKAAGKVNTHRCLDPESCLIMGRVVFLLWLFFFFGNAFFLQCFLQIVHLSGEIRNLAPGFLFAFFIARGTGL
jgi:hypothetical protein